MSSSAIGEDTVLVGGRITTGSVATNNNNQGMPALTSSRGKQSSSDGQPIEGGFANLIKQEAVAQYNASARASNQTPE